MSKGVGEATSVSVDAETKAMRERQETLQSSLQTVRRVSRQAGNILPISVVEEAGDINPEPGVYLIEGDRLSSTNVRDVSFELEEKLLSGIADSAHAVMVGDLSIEFRDADPQSLRVAAKSYFKRNPQDRFDRALTELVVMQDLQKRGELTFRPVALALASNADGLDYETILVTEYDPSILTLDNVTWGRGLNTENRELALHAVQTLAHFNADIGYLHKDAKIKNVAQDEGGQLFGMIDFETTEAIDPNNPSDASLATVVDLGRLIDSLVQKRLFARASVEEADAFLGEMADSYLAGWADSSEEVQAAVLQSLITVRDHSIMAITGQELPQTAAN